MKRLGEAYAPCECADGDARLGAAEAHRLAQSLRQAETTILAESDPLRIQCGATSPYGNTAQGPSDQVQDLAGDVDATVLVDLRLDRLHRTIRTSVNLLQLAACQVAVATDERFEAVGDLGGESVGGQETCVELLVEGSPFAIPCEAGDDRLAIRLVLGGDAGQESSDYFSNDLG